MADKYVGVTLTPEAQLIYPNIISPRTSRKDHTGVERPLEKPQYESMLRFLPDATLVVGAVTITMQTLYEKMQAAALEQWPATQRDYNANPVHWPLKDGTAYADNAKARGKDYEWARGHIIMRVHSPKPVGCIDANQQPIIEDAKLYGGCWVTCDVNFVGQNGNGSTIPDSVTVYLNSVMKLRDGERIGGRDPVAAFAGVQGGTSPVNPMAGMPGAPQVGALDGVGQQAQQAPAPAGGQPFAFPNQAQQAPAAPAPQVPQVPAQPIAPQAPNFVAPGVPAQPTTQTGLRLDDDIPF